MNKRIYFILFFFALVIRGSLSAKELVDYVNPLIGTQSEFQFSNGNTYPAIAMPWGMNFWTPQTGKMGDGWTYNYNHYQIRGFKQTHQPSPWINDYGQFSIMPVIGNKINEEERKSWFSHKTEIARPYYYSVYLADYDIVTEVSPTERAVMFQVTFPQSDSSKIVIDAFDKGSYVKIIPGQNKVIGYTTRNSGGVPDNFKNYFVIEFDKPFDNHSVWNEYKLSADLAVKGEHAGAIVGFKTRKGEQVHIRVASSFISIEQAERNLQELGTNDFDALKERGKQRWNEVLGRISIEADEDQMQMFYSCLYRSTLFPRMFYEYDALGKAIHYSPFSGEILPGYLFTDTGFWDSFRALFPLLNLIYPEINAKIQEGLLNTYLESGFMPEWASPGHRDCMVGNNSASVIADAILKEVTPKELWLPLYEGMVKTANNSHPQVKSTGRMGVNYYNHLGYVPCNVGIHESAARTLEYAYDDWCIAQVAKKLGRPDKEVQLYLNRSQNYRNLFDPEYKLMRGKNEDGSFQSPFNPLKWGDAFTEGNSWHYTWSVFHDVDGLISLMGGKTEFVAMLDSIFAIPPTFDNSYYGFTIHEIREMQVMNMGNYAHGNQPIQHMIYLYNYAGEPHKAQYRLREVMKQMYKPTPDGYCGDEDNGQTSAWYVFSALGFYPVCPGAEEYAVGSPLVRQATIHFPNGKLLKINVKNNTPDNRLVKQIHFNGHKVNRPFFNYHELKKGGKIVVEMETVKTTSIQ